MSDGRDDSDSGSDGEPRPRANRRGTGSASSGAKRTSARRKAAPRNSSATGTAGNPDDSLTPPGTDSGAAPASSPSDAPEPDKTVDRSGKTSQDSGPFTAFYAPFMRRFSSLPGIPRVNIHDGIEKIIYIGALVGGSIFIFITKILGLLGHWPIVIIAAIVISIYAVTALMRRENRVRMDRYGDNCYYLGLTYTLVSMFVALINLRPGVAPDELIGAFGIALGSTIVGIIWRLILIQLRSEVDDVETKARLDLADASDRLRIQLVGASSSFQNFAFAIQSTVKDSVVSMTDDQLGKQSQLIAHFSQVLEQSVQTISNTSAGIQTSLERHSQISQQFEEASTRSIEAARSLAEKVESVVIPEDLLTKGFTDISRELGQSVTALREAVSSLQVATSAVGGASTHLAGFATNSKQALDAFEGFSAAAKGVSTSMQAMVATIEKGTGDIGERNSTLDAELVRLKSLTKDYAANLAEVANFLAKEISGRAADR